MMPIAILTAFFVWFKLLGYIDWSWWLVLLPAYIVPLLILLEFVIDAIKPRT